MMYDEKLVEQARNTDFISFLERYYNFSFNINGGEYRCKQHSSLSVKNDRLTWFWHSKGIGGRGALDLLIKAFEINFCEAMDAVNSTPTATVQPHSTEQSKTLIIPEKAGLIYIKDCLPILTKLGVLMAT